MDDITDASGAFALRLCADLLTALVVTGVLPKAYATTLVDESLREFLVSHPYHDAQAHEIAATLTAQIALVSIDLERKMGKP